MSTQPNIIFILSDQQRWDTLGCYGQPLDVTPNLDALARRGVQFQHAFTCQPVCGPARACVQTGKYATEIGCFRNDMALPLDEETLAHHLSASGYEVGYIGKWHLASQGVMDYKTKPIPPERRGGYKDFWLASDVLEFTSHGYDGWMFDQDMNKVAFSGYRVDALTDFTLDYLKNRTLEQPFFLFLSYIEPHHQNDRNQFEGPVGSRERFANYTVPGDLEGTGGDWVKGYPDYLGCCASLDENVGRILQQLEQQGIAEDTLVIYTSDHGCHFRTRANEYKRSCHDNSIRIPMIIAGPQFNGGRVEQELVSLIDLPPTVLQAAGVTPPEKMQGRPLQDLLHGENVDWPQDIFVQISENQTGRALRTKRWKYSVSVPAGDWHSTKRSDLYIEEFLYDLQVDPHERENLICNEEYEAVRQELRQRLLQRMAEANETEPQILPARGNRYSVMETYLRETGKVVSNVYTDLSVWHYGRGQKRIWADVAENTIKSRYPFLQYVSLFCPTGGNAARDLLVDPEHPEKGYDFSPLVAGCSSIIRQGLRPYLKVGSVPPSFSEDVQAGEFSTNVRPPVDWDQYYDYLHRCFMALRDCFGVAEMKQWKWSIIPEIENESWFRAADDDPNVTKEAAYRLYDLTVAALEAVLGKENVYVGVHFMRCTKGFWDEMEFIARCASSTKIDFIAVSHYQWMPGTLNTNRTLEDTINPLRKKARALGLDLQYGVDEGYILFGADGPELKGSRTIGHTWQVSKEATYFKQALDHDWDYYAKWAMTTSGGNWDDPLHDTTGPVLNCVNVLRLAGRMVGATRLPLQVSGVQSDSTNEIDGIVAFNSKEDTLYVMLYNHNEATAAVGAEDIALIINNLCPVSDQKVTVSRWVIDKDHGNFWHYWWDERGSTASYSGSKYDHCLWTLTDPTDTAYWRENQDRYEKLAQLGAPRCQEADVKDGQLTLNETLSHHSVMFLELKHVTILEDDMIAE